MSFWAFIAMPTGNAQIRAAIPADADSLTQIAWRSKAHWGYPQHLLDLWANDLLVSPESCDGENIWVLECGDITVGFGEIIVDGDTAILDDLWIDPGYIGRGYGKLLFRHLRNMAMSRGATRLSIEAEPFATGFYERMGARIVGEIASASVPDRSLPLMELDLTNPENTTINPE